MSDKPNLDFGGEGGFDDSYLQEQTGRDRVAFGSRLRADIYEKLKAASFHEDVQQADILERALARELARMEEARGEEYEVLEPHEVDD